VAAIARVRPSQKYVVGLLYGLNNVAMAGLTPPIQTEKRSGLRGLMTAPTRRLNVGALKRKASALVFPNLTLRPPVLFAMAGLALRAELPAVDVFVAPAAALTREDFNGAAIIVASKALGPCMCTFEGVSGALEVIKLEVVDELGPSIAFVAEGAIGREVCVPNDGSSVIPPAVHWHLSFADAGEQYACGENEERGGAHPRARVRGRGVRAQKDHCR
jgi:hypothetical protein